MQKIVEHCEELKYRLCQNISQLYKKAIYELRDQAELDLEALNKTNPVGAYALCPLIEESVEAAPNKNTAPSKWMKNFNEDKGEPK